MSELKATPGPWTVQGGEIVSAADPICSMPTLYRFTGEAKERLAADAHLIASAPDLYEALAYARDNIGDPVPIGRRHVARKIDAALARARGDVR